MWRVDGAGGEDHFSLRINAFDRPPALVFDCDGTAAVEHNTVYLCLDDHLEIGPLLCRPQIGASGTGSTASAARLLAPPNAIAGAGRQVVYVLAVLEADLLTSLDYCRTKRRPIHLRGK